MLDKDGINAIDFIYNSDILCYYIQLFHNADKGNGESVSSIEANDLHFDVYCRDEIYIAYSNIDGSTYVVQTKSMDDMILVIGGLKKSQNETH